ncbi:hypothetical protein C8F01DRAFT_537904 [Mycena amicta]|nr:hypothetical protein C8F01DRAFT_537904 [Mycena amicta]
MPFVSILQDVWNHDKTKAREKLRRKQKIKCDGPKAKDGCSHCTYFGLQCTYLQPVKRRGPKKKEAATTNVEQLQQQIAILEAKLRALSVCALCSQPLRTLSESSDSLVPSVDASHPLDNRTEDESADSSDEDDIFVAQFGCISLGPSFSFGAGFDYVLAAKAVIPQDTPPGQKAIKQLEAFNSLSWDDIQPWEQQLYEQTPQYVFPEQDLMDSLICLYFDNVHSTLPILHRESFERSVSEETHKRDHHFAASLLAVLSYSDDPRVLVDGYSTLSSGWKFITQVPILRRGFEPNIYDVQYYFLLALYALTTSKAQDSWIYLVICPTTFSTSTHEM